MVAFCRNIRLLLDVLSSVSIEVLSACFDTPHSPTMWCLIMKWKLFCGSAQHMSKSFNLGVNLWNRSWEEVVLDGTRVNQPIPTILHCWKGCVWLKKRRKNETLGEQCTQLCFASILDLRQGHSDKQKCQQEWMILHIQDASSVTHRTILLCMFKNRLSDNNYWQCTNIPGTAANRREMYFFHLRQRFRYALKNIWKVLCNESNLAVLIASL